MEISGDIKKTSAMIDGSISSNFNLHIIYNHLNVNDEIVYLTYNNKKKFENREEICKTFNNQISIKLLNGINIKIFNTGAFSISGAGNVEHALDNAKDSLNKVLNKIKAISFIREIAPKKDDIFYTFYDNRVITYSTIKDVYISKYPFNNNKIIIDGEHYEHFDILPSLYVQIKHKNKQKKLYNNMAKEVGYIEYITNRKTKSLCIKNCIYQKIDDFNYKIINKYNNQIGTLKITLLDSSDLVILPENIKLLAEACDKSSYIQEMKFSNCNYNFQLKLKTEEFIDRNLVCDFLTKKSIKYTYDPCSYPGVKFTIFNTKITIFRTGSILFSSKNDIYKDVYPFILSIFKENMICSIIEDSNEELTIWDI